MKHCCWLLSLICLPIILTGQDSYTDMTHRALHLMWEAEDSMGWRKSLSLYEQAFAQYPDSIDHLGMYKASILAGQLKEYDKAFTYLKPVAEIEEDEYGNPGWEYVAGEYASIEYKNLLGDPRWKVFEAQALAKKKTFLNRLKDSQKEFFNCKNLPLEKVGSGRELYQSLKSRQQYLPKRQRDYSISLPVDDTSATSYFVHLPQDYDPAKAYPLLIFLHGAVRYNSFADYQTKGVLGGWNRFYTKYADQHEVILVFPQGSKQYNWMVPDDGFHLIPTIVYALKKAININENKVFLSGHSNGATGSFSYLMKKPTPFAGFYGFNTYPKVFTGGTFIENALNRSFINFSTDQDYYYPPTANDQLNQLMAILSADYKDHRYDGFPHWFPEFDESEPAYQILFNDLLARERNPFPNSINWEFDDEQYGQIDWLTDMKMDTSVSMAEWHQPRNFEIDKWLTYDDNDSLVWEKVDKQAFDLPRKSAKIKAEYQDNVFKIKTSCLKGFQLNISPEMVNMRKKVKVLVNGVLYFDDKLDYDKSFMLSNFNQDRDREQIWVNYIKVDI